MIMVEDTGKNIQAEGSFYSNEIYEFHEYAELLPLMNQAEIEDLGISIEQNGQEDDIALYENKILDGRNRYLACHGRGITPRFRRFNSFLDPLVYVKVRNVDRRHLNTAQRAEVALNFLDVERKRAKKRQKLTQFNGRDKNNSPKFKSSVVDKLSPTEKNQRKGRSIVLVAEEWEISPTTLKKVKKIKKIAETNLKIHEQWEKAKNKEKSIEEVYRNVQALEAQDKEKVKQGDLLLKTDQIIKAARSDSEIQAQLEKAKNNEITIDEVHKNVQKITKLKKSITEHTVDNFKKAGEEYKAKKRKNNTEEKDQTEQRLICKQCPLATVSVLEYPCDLCSHINFIPGVLCDKDIKNGERKIRYPYSPICENSPDYDLLSRRNL